MLTEICRHAVWTVTDTVVIAERNLMRYIRSPDMVVFLTIQPIMFVLLFNFVFGGAISVGGTDYINFLLPGIILQTTIFGATQTGIGLNDDLAKGIIDRFRSLPMARPAVLAGRILADTLANVFVVGVMLGVGYAIGFRFGNGAAAALGRWALRSALRWSFPGYRHSSGLAPGRSRPPRPRALPGSSRSPSSRRRSCR